TSKKLWLAARGCQCLRGWSSLAALERENGDFSGHPTSGPTRTESIRKSWNPHLARWCSVQVSLGLSAIVALRLALDDMSNWPNRLKTLTSSWLQSLVAECSPMPPQDSLDVHDARVLV